MGFICNNNWKLSFLAKIAPTDFPRSVGFSRALLVLILLFSKTQNARMKLSRLENTVPILVWTV